MSIFRSKVQQCLCGLLMTCCFVSNAYSQTELEDRVLDLEAQVVKLNADLESTKALASQERANAFNPAISVIGDVIGQYEFKRVAHDHHEHPPGDHDHHHGHQFENGFFFREIEFEFRGETPYADALVTIALEPHGVHAAVHIEEAYVRLKSWPGLGYSPLGMTITAGKFKTALGRMNRIHMHNLPHITYPLALVRFLGDEGYASHGISVQTGFNPTRRSALNFFIESTVLSKLPFQKEGAQKIPSGIFHAWWHQELARAHFLDFGMSSLLGRKGGVGSGAFALFGADLHYSYIPSGYGQDPLFLFGSEVYSARIERGWPIGTFAWLQFRMRGNTFLGLRYDLAPQEEKPLQLEHAASLYLTYYASEFLRFRAGYEHAMPDIHSLRGNERLMISMSFLFGSHPVEPYFANR